MSLDLASDRFDGARAQIRTAIGCVTAAWAQVAMTGTSTADYEFKSALDRIRDLLGEIDAAEQARADDVADRLAEAGAGPAA